MDRTRKHTVAALRRQAEQEQWPVGRLPAEISRRLGVSALLAHRLAAGRTQQQTAAELRRLYQQETGLEARLSHQQVSKWEQGQDRPEKYLNALCKLYATRLDLLGLAIDCTEDATGPGSPATPGRREDQPTFDRRSLLTAAGSALFLDFDDMRTRTERELRKDWLSEETLERGEHEVRDLGLQIRTVDPQVFLAQAGAVYHRLNDLLSQRQTPGRHRRLTTSMAELAGLIALDLNALGDPWKARSWFQTSQSLADEYDNTGIRSWAMSYEAMTHLWHGGSPQRALQLADSARDRARREPSSPSGALATAIMGRALARLDRRGEAQTAIQNAETMWSELDRQARTEETSFGFYEHLLRMYQSDVFTTIGRYAEAERAQNAAMSLAGTGPQLDVDTALVQLDRALCLARRDAPEQSVRTVLDTVLSLPEGFQSGTVVQRTVRVREELVALGHGGLVAEVEEWLRANTPRR